MKLKLDENLGERGREILSRAGHDVATVASQSLEKAEDAKLITRCQREGREGGEVRRTGIVVERHHINSKAP